MTYLHSPEAVFEAILASATLSRKVKAWSHIAVPGEGTLGLVEDDHPIQLVLSAKALLPFRGKITAREHLAAFELTVVVGFVLLPE